MKFRGEETTKLVNLIVKGILFPVVFTGGFFGRPLSFLYKNTQPRQGPLTATRILPEHIFFLTNMLLVNAGNCYLNDNISCWIVEQ